MSEQVRTHIAGQGASGDTEVTSTSQKMWYPFTPDVIEGVHAAKEWDWVDMVGGHTYYTNAKWKNGKGSAMNAGLQGCWYDGSKKSEHKDHKFSVFAGGTGAPISRDKVNGNGDSGFENRGVQFPGSLVVHCNGYQNLNHQGSQWQMYAKNGEGLGFPYPVYGVSIDYTPVRKASTLNGDGNVWSHDTAKFKYAHDCQISFFHAVYWQAGGTSYSSRKLLPNGDNWGDTRGGADYSDIPGGKYCFRDSDNLGDENFGLMGGNAQEKQLVEDSKGGGGKTFTLRLMLPPGEGPPKNSYFVGITMQMVYGKDADQPKDRQYMISNLGVIDKVAYDIYRNDPSYSGINAKQISNPRIVLPKLYDFENVAYPNSPRMYGPMQSW